MVVTLDLHRCLGKLRVQEKEREVGREKKGKTAMGGQTQRDSSPIAAINGLCTDTVISIMRRNR